MVIRDYYARDAEHEDTPLSRLARPPGSLSQAGIHRLIDAHLVEPRAAREHAFDMSEKSSPADLRRRARPAKPLVSKPLAGDPMPARPHAAKSQSAKSQSAKSKPTKPRAMNLTDVRAFIQALAVANPRPTTELHYVDPFTLLVAVVLSAQATDVSVNRATETLFQEAATPAAMMALGVDGVARHIRSIGLWQGKARNVVELSRQLVEHHDGQVPRDRAALEALPGVGRKTANVVLNVAFGESTMAVDTHIFRIGNRTGLAPGRTPRAVEDALVRRIPAELLRDAHNWLILHGRYVCKARQPECWRCVVAQWCCYADKTESAPSPRRVERES